MAVPRTPVLLTRSRVLLLVALAAAAGLAAAVATGRLRLPHLAEGFDTCGGARIIRYTIAGSPLMNSCINLDGVESKVLANVFNFTVPQLPIKVFDQTLQAWTRYATVGSVIKTTPGRKYTFMFA